VVWVLGIKCDPVFASELSSSRRENSHGIAIVHHAMNLRSKATRSGPVESREDRGLFWHACDYAQSRGSVGNGASVRGRIFGYQARNEDKNGRLGPRKVKLWMIIEVCTSAWG
jgi:hypothetical protein